MQDWLDNLGPVFLPDAVNRQHPLNQGRQAWWLVLSGLEGGKYFCDLLGLAHGTLTSMAIASTGWDRMARPGGWGSLSFNGSASWVQGPGTVHAGPSGVTLAAWVRPTSVTQVGDGTHRTIITKRSGSTTEWGFDFDRASGGSTGDILYSLRFYIYSGAWHIWNTAANILPGDVWTHVAVTYNNVSYPVAYINGVAFPTTEQYGTGVGAIQTNTINVGIGSYVGAASPDTPWLGWMDDISVWNYPMSAAAIMELYTLSQQYYPGVLNRLASPLWPAGVTPAGGQRVQISGGGSRLIRGQWNTVVGGGVIPIVCGCDL